MNKDNTELKVPYSQRRYSNAAANLVVNEEPAPGYGAAVNVKIIVDPKQYGKVEYTIGGGSDIKKNPGTPVQPKYDRFSTYSTAQGASAGMETETINIRLAVGQYVVLSPKAKDGCYFKQWSDGVKAIQRTITATQGMSDLVLTAYFYKPAEVVYHTVNVQASPSTGGTVTANGLVNGQASVQHGDSIRLTATPKSGYVFKVWAGITPGAYNIDLYSPTINLPVEKNYSLTAKFEAVKPNDDPQDPGQDPGNGGSNGGGTTGGGSNGGSSNGGGSNGGIEEPVPGGGSNGNTGVATKSFVDEVAAFVKKWWWALLIAYLVLNEKGGKE